MNSSQSSPGELPAAYGPVLIVDDSAETRDVLRTVLTRHGVATLEAAEARNGVEMIRRYQPRVVVFDLEAEAADEDDVRADLELEIERHQADLIVLGRARHFESRLPQEQVLHKPYHFAPLVRTIQRLCARERGEAA